MNDLIGLVIAVVLVAVLVLLSAAESALTGISRARAEALGEDDVPGASMLVESLADRGRLVAPILLLSLGAQLTIGAILAVLVERRWGPNWVPPAVVVLVVVLFVIAESAPKTWALRNIDRSAPIAATASRLLLAIPPLRWAVSALVGLASMLLLRSSRSSAAVASEEEIVALTDAAVEAAVLHVDEGEIIQSIVDFGDTIVREVMVPRPDVLAASSDTSVDSAIEQLVEAEGATSCRSPNGSPTSCRRPSGHPICCGSSRVCPTAWWS